ncbi:hypothetical protein IPJ72_05265 [Candidatus Peregrinibacteria bacterium]|nr:MAG: hypothetical protein IPJ72_05265 [Candidatus Peregrinibacteria bacterium]
MIIVTVLFLVLTTTSLGVFIGARKITGQSYIQGQAAITLSETNDILHHLRNLDFTQLNNGTFFLIRNPGTGSWLVKSDVPDMDTFERQITVSDALRHSGSNDLYFDGDTGQSSTDTNTKRVDISILWSPDYIPDDLASHTVYVTDWLKTVNY